MGLLTVGPSSSGGAAGRNVINLMRWLFVKKNFLFGIHKEHDSGKIPVQQELHQMMKNGI